MKDILAASPILPILNFSTVDEALNVVEILAENGITVIELSLGNKNAFTILNALIKHFSHLTIGVGTVINTEQLHQVQYLGAQFAVSPGFLPSLVNSARIQDFPFLPGVSSISEAMMAHELGINTLKLYPAEVIGGVGLLKHLEQVLPTLCFCPSGGITAQNKDRYLNCSNVISVASSTIAPTQFIADKNWNGLRTHTEQLFGHVYV